MAKSAKTITLANELQGDGSAKLASAWSPLRESVFRALWIATVVSNIGTWMQDVGEAWLMTSLTSSPVLVALVETAAVCQWCCWLCRQERSQTLSIAVACCC